MQKTCIVIPCFNEADRLDEESFLRYTIDNPGVHFLFVNDGSSDCTEKLLSNLVNKNKEQFFFITREKNLGKGESVREGILRSFSWKTFDFVGYFDADLATPLAEISCLLEEFDNMAKTIVVFGSRRKTNENNIKRNNLRHNFGRLYAGFTTLLLSLDVYDTQCGAKIFKSEAAKELFDYPFIDRWLFDVEIFCRIKKKNRHNFSAVIKEVNLRTWEEKGHSRIQVLDVLKLPFKTVKIFLRYL